ncbi:type IV pilin N-terminal domain-containing protein [uncultured Methanomethylovorans sp.]|uniref:type IV pilin N-terminal domain-containing protein n=1 Tax=uncultured Methanomethylovorans sp. TaxID=183759 RepID=UPI002AA85851|nr:type IV pilin N-terminal domain-containing protein [uncultured Methanomethylovorans sp.]
MKMLKDSKAVSPVIGVMLMLVVTVILAAAVSSTSSGLMKSSDAAPTAVFDVKIAKDVDVPAMSGTTSYITIKEVTGDAIQTENLKIVTTNPNAEGGNGTREILPGVLKSYGVSAVPGTVPYWNNVGEGYFGGYNSVTYTYDGNPTVDFGNYTVKPGVSMTAQDYVTTYSDDNVAAWDATAGDYTLGTGDTIGQMQDMFADWDSVEQGDFLNVKIVDLKSGKVIFTSDVEVV